MINEENVISSERQYTENFIDMYERAAQEHLGDASYALWKVYVLGRGGIEINYSKASYWRAIWEIQRSLPIKCY